MPGAKRPFASNVAARVLLVDDHELFCQALSILLEANDSVTEVRTCSDTLEALAIARSWHPNLALMDVSMPGVSGIAATLELCAMSEPPRVIMLSGHDDEDVVVEALRAGARGYLLKQSAFEELSFAISVVMRGGLYVANALTEKLDLDELVKRAHSTNSVSRIDSLTEREREVMRLIAEGYTSREIAEMLRISPRTVEGHRERLMAKLGVHNKVELTRLALRHGAVLSETEVEPGFAPLVPPK